ncbi:hypothetical protein C1X05_01040 [Laceyella sacchari]|uniref:Uncharacterized protein n=2 Tax=Laceyella TaxID=292635 RepID=A0AA45WRE9_9BACL|nr:MULTISPECIES: hypothetical protein [Laceyella]AUS07579.1 hypothetical protein C1X05_01040 [Laceyella sacchari]UWE03808.1 hypothetical protein NYR52_00930 [Laceyella sacchari]SMP30708.1 hypothetical protein SAMN06265361_107100 [Laceyella tengchongensis]
MWFKYMAKHKRSLAIIMLAFILFNITIPFSYPAYADLQVKEVQKSGDVQKDGDLVKKADTKKEANPEKSAWDKSVEWITTDQGYKVIKWTFNDFFIAKIAGVHEVATSMSEPNGLSSSAKITGALTVSAIVRGGISIFTQDRTWQQGLMDSWDAIEKGVTLHQFVNWSNIAPYVGTKIQNLRNFATPIGGAAADSSTLLKSVAPLSKVAKVAGWAGIAFSTVEMVSGYTYAFNSPDGSQQQADAVLTGTAGLGSLALTAGLMIGAACPPLAVGLAVGGALVWGAATVGKYFTGNKTVRKVVTAPVRWVKSWFD